MFLSSVLTNSEVWYRMTNSDLEELEVLDRSLLRRILSAPNSTPVSALYLETGCLSIGTIIKARRLNYLQYLVKLPHEEMLSRFFYCQWLESNPTDWTMQVRKDLADFNLPEDLQIIGDKTLFSWKNLVKKKAKEFELRNMKNIKETKNKSKMSNLNYEKFERQEYFTTLQVKHVKTLFRFRTRMAPFEGNFKGQGPVDSCPLCGLHSDLQHLSFNCPVVIEKVEPTEEYEQIFGTKISTELAKCLQRMIELRKKEE